MMDQNTSGGSVFAAVETENSEDAQWYRGQLHIHTNEHDKTDIVKWYKNNGYNFAVLTDLNYATPVDGLKSVYDKPGEFITVPGIETSTYYDGTIHDVMGYGGTPRKVQSEETRSVDVDSEPAVETYSKQVKMLSEAGCIPAVAHPNLTWAADADEILSLDANLLRHFEMITTEPGMNDAGGGGAPSTTEIWDKILSTGRSIYAIASDDSHHFDRIGPETNHVHGDAQSYAPSLPGRTSVFVRATELSVAAITQALRDGDFYSVKHPLTLPIEFEELQVTSTEISIKLPEISKDIGWSSDAHNAVRYQTEFVGVKGEAVTEGNAADHSEVLKTDSSYQPEYEFDGDELYVRACIRDSDGATAWTQPTFLDDN